MDKALAQADPTNVSPINFTVTFNEDVADFDSSDLTLAGSAGATTAVVTGGPQVYNVAVSGMASDGDVTLTFTGSASDAATNANQAPTYGDNTVAYDTSGPTVSVDKALGQADPTNVSPINFTVTFNEDVADFTAPTSRWVVRRVRRRKVVTGGPQVYNVAVSSMTSDGNVTLTFTGTAHDGTGNANQAPTYGDNTVAYDTTGPTVNVDKALGQADPTNASPINFTVTFNEDVADFDELRPDAGRHGGCDHDGRDWWAAGLQRGGLGDDLGRQRHADVHGFGADAATNANQAPSYGDNTVRYDTTGPTVNVDKAFGQADPTNVSPINFTVDVQRGRGRLRRDRSHDRRARPVRRRRW